MILEEGGAAVRDVARIIKANLEPTLDEFELQVISNIDNNGFAIIGSTGKKPSNGDIDLAFDTSLSLDEISGELEKLGIEHVVSKGLGEINTRFPQYDISGEQTGEYVQIDLMVGNLEWLQFAFFTVDESQTKYKAMYHTATLFGLLRSTDTEPEPDALEGWSMASSRGVFRRISRKYINRNGNESTKAEKLSEYFPSPTVFCEVISEKSSEPWAPEELMDSCEHIWDKIRQRFDEATQTTIFKAITRWCENQGLEDPHLYTPLAESRSPFREAVESLIVDERNHGTHAEDMVLYGDKGIDFALDTFDTLFEELKGHTPEAQRNVTIKIDGGPVVIAGNSFAGIDRPFVANKAFIGEKEANEGARYATNEEELVALYGDRPGLLIKMRTLLRLVPKLGIPDGEAWRGDMLFGPKVDGTKSVTMIEKDGEKLYAFHPVTIQYTVPVDSEIGRRVAQAEIGVAWHTKYVGDSIATAAPDFSVRASDLNDIPEVFSLDHRLDNLAGVVTLTQEETDKIEASLRECRDLEQQLIARPDYDTIVHNEDFIHTFFMTFQNSFLRERKPMDPAVFVDGLIDWGQKKYDKEIAKLKKDTAIQARRDKFAQYQTDVNSWRETLNFMVTLMIKMADVKAIFITKLNAISGIGTNIHFMSTDTWQPTNHEGYFISDMSGNSIKLVDRQEFTTLAFNPDTEKGWQTEAKVPLTESRLQESPASDAWEKKVASDITKKFKKHGLVAERPQASTSFSDVLVIYSAEEIRTWLEVKMNHTDNLSNPRFFFDGKKWDSTYGGIAPTLVEYLNESAEAKKFVSEIGKFAGIKGKPIIPTNKAAIRDADPTTTITRDTMANFLKNRSQYVLDIDDVDLAPFVIAHYKNKAQPASYLQAGDDFYILTGDPLKINQRAKGTGRPRVPKIMGSGKLRVRIGVRSEFYEIQAEIKIAHMPESPYSVLAETEKYNPFDVLIEHPN